MASQSAPTPSLVTGTASGSEPDETLSNQELPKYPDVELWYFDSLVKRLSWTLVDDLMVKKQYGRYHSVHVLFLLWGDSPNSVVKDVQNLSLFMEKKLHFTSDIYQIRFKNQLEDQLERCIHKYAGATELLIIHYAGESRLDVANNNTIWQGHTSPSAADSAPKSLNWTAIETRLNYEIAQDSNILYILDCCYTPKLCPPSSRGTKELLAASKDVPKSTSVYTSLFTADLLHELRQQTEATGSINVSTLHSRIKARQAARQIPEPYHLALSEKASTSSIVLAEGKESAACIPTSLIESQSITFCMIRLNPMEDIKKKPGAEKLWVKYILEGKAIEKEGLKVYEADYMKYLHYAEINRAHVFLVVMPTEVSRGLARRAPKEGFTQLKTAGSGATLDAHTKREAWRLADSFSWNP